MLTQLPELSSQSSFFQKGLRFRAKKSLRGDRHCPETVPDLPLFMGLGCPSFGGYSGSSAAPPGNDSILDWLNVSTHSQTADEPIGTLAAYSVLAPDHQNRDLFPSA